MIFELTEQCKVLFKKQSSNKTMIMSLTASKIFVSIFGVKGGALSFHMLGTGRSPEQPSSPLCLKAFEDD